MQENARSVHRREPMHPALAEGGDLVPALTRVAKQARTLLGLRLAPIGLVVGQEQMLLALEAEASKSSAVLATELMVRPSTVSKMLSGLADKGLVVRTGDAGDARKVLACLTPDGLVAQSRVRRVLADLEEEMRRALDDDVAGAVTTLGRLGEALAARLRRLR